MRNYTTRPPDYIEENPDDPYYPDAIEKYFAEYMKTIHTSNTSNIAKSQRNE
jgi:hypothetical protein